MAVYKFELFEGWFYFLWIVGEDEGDGLLEEVSQVVGGGGERWVCFPLYFHL